MATIVPPTEHPQDMCHRVKMQGTPTDLGWDREGSGLSTCITQMGLLGYLLVTRLHTHKLPSDTQQLGQDLNSRAVPSRMAATSPGLADVVVEQVNTGFETLMGENTQNGSLTVFSLVTCCPQVAKFCVNHRLVELSSDYVPNTWHLDMGSLHQKTAESRAAEQVPVTPPMDPPRVAQPPAPPWATSVSVSEMSPRTATVALAQKVLGSRG